MVLTLAAIGYAALLIVLALIVLARLERRPTAAPAPARDPYAAAVADFRRDLNDWDRRGRPGA